MRIQRIKPQHIKEEVIAKETNLDLITPLIVKYAGKKGSLIPLLQGTQDIYGYIPEEVFYIIAEKTDYKLSTMYGVATFYAQFRLSPVGKHIVKVCHGTACHVQNAKAITVALQEFLKIDDGATTPDGLFTLESVACLGCCSLAPVMMIGDETYGKLNAKNTKKIIRTIKKNEK